MLMNMQFFKKNNFNEMVNKEWNEVSQGCKSNKDQATKS